MNFKGDLIYIHLTRINKKKEQKRIFQEKELHIGRKKNV